MHIHIDSKKGICSIDSKPYPIIGFGTYLEHIGSLGMNVQRL